MRMEINEKVGVWLEKLGYSFNSKLYGPLGRISNATPSYKIMADIVLSSIKKHNSTLDSKEAWNYTTKFINGMKSNLIINNKYFQSVMEKGLFSPLNNKQNYSINLFSIEQNNRNEYNFLKNFKINNENNFDFIILINSFPVGVIKTFNKEVSSFEEEYSKLEINFKENPMFFNFNKFILFTDGCIYKLGTLYDFPEEYIDFQNKSYNVIGKNQYTIDELEELLLNENILKSLHVNKNSKEIERYIDYKLRKKEKEIIEKNQWNQEINNINSERKREDLNENEELKLLVDFFNPDLSEVLDSENFQKRLNQTSEVPDFKENKSYIEDFQKNRNMSSLEIFIKANERLVIKEANKFINYQTTSMDFDDMYQLGYIGLLKAVERFDLDMENEFSTYAIHWIRQSIMRGINDSSLLIRIPVHRWDSLTNLRKLEYKSEIKFNKVDYNWISKEADLSKEKIMELVMIKNNFMNNISLDTPVGVDKSTSLGELIVEEDCSVEEIIIKMDLKNSIDEILKRLDPRSRDIIIKRFGLNGEKSMTLEEIGKIHNVSRERIRQIESKTLKKLRYSPKNKKYRVYCEG